jgi:epoxyqueuosine reductase QueG
VGIARAMLLNNNKHRFLISPEIGNQFILISILTPAVPPCQAHSVAAF